MAKKKKTEYCLKEENFFSPLLKMDKEEKGDGGDAEGSAEGSGREGATTEAPAEPEGGGDSYDQLGIKPQVEQQGTKKTTVVNFKDVCRLLRCQPKQLQAFLSVELGGTAASIDSHNRLVLRGKVQQKRVEQALRKYFKEHVEGRAAHLSPKTLLPTEENGMANGDTSRSAVAGIKSGSRPAAVKKADVDSLDPSVSKKKKTKKKKHTKKRASYWTFFYVLLFIAVLAGILIFYL